MKVAVTSKTFCKNANLMGRLLEYFEVKPNTHDKLLTTEQTIELLHDCDGAIVALEQIDENILKHCPKLKIISKYGVGVDNINIDDCNKYGVSVGWVSGVNKTSVAEMTLGFMLMLIRNLYITSNQLKNGVWNKNGGNSLYEKTIGIIGVGNVGKEVIKLLKPFDCKILVNDIIEQKEYYKNNSLIEATKNDIFEQCDIITIHTPLTDETKFLINVSTLSLMKKNAFVINTARGNIINLKDLKEALKCNKIAGAAIDVYDSEPPSDEELLKLPNLICTPHIGGNSAEAVLAMGESAIDVFIKLLKPHQHPWNQIEFQTKHWKKQYLTCDNIDGLVHSWAKYSNDDIILQVISSLIDKQKDMNILELGSYTGRFTRHIIKLRSEINFLTKIICADIIEEPFEYIQNTYFTPQMKNIDLDFYLSKGFELQGINDNSLDFIFGIDCLTRTEIKYIESYIKEFSRILKPNGIIMIHLPIDTKEFCNTSCFTPISQDIIEFWCNQSQLTIIKIDYSIIEHGVFLFAYK